MLESLDSAKKIGPETLRQQRPALTTTRKDRAMAKSHILTVEVLRQLLDYNPVTGLLTWKPRGEIWFPETGGHKQSHRMKVWNAKWAGKPALNHMSKNGYRAGAVLNIAIQSHRAAYAVMTGVELAEIPSIDHINGQKGDNRFSNLRVVSTKENAHNMPIYRTNKTGVHGLAWEQSHKAWAVKINFNGKQRRVGRFKCFGKAVLARKMAERQFGYHPNHGRANVAIGG